MVNDSCYFFMVTFDKFVVIFSTYINFILRLLLPSSQKYIASSFLRFLFQNFYLCHNILAYFPKIRYIFLFLSIFAHFLQFFPFLGSLRCFFSLILSWRIHYVTMEKLLETKLFLLTVCDRLYFMLPFGSFVVIICTYFSLSIFFLSQSKVYYSFSRIFFVVVVECLLISQYLDSFLRIKYFFNSP